MKQLTARLREWPEWDSEPSCHEVPPPSLLLEAADEIERLMSVVARVNARCDHLGMRLGEVISERDKLRLKHDVVTNYWLDFYCADHCTLCGNWGWIDTRGVRTPAGVQVGRVNYCICPNGQALRAGGAEVRRL